MFESVVLSSNSFCLSVCNQLCSTDCFMDLQEQTISIFDADEPSLSHLPFSSLNFVASYIFTVWEMISNFSRVVHLLHLHVSEIWWITELWIGLNFKILSLVCVLLVLWWHPGIFHKRCQVRALFMIDNFCHWISLNSVKTFIGKFHQ